MAVEDIKGYKPHTTEKINRVNAIKDAEVRLGLIFSAIEDELREHVPDQSDEDFNADIQALSAIVLAKDRLKEASMWACRAVFRPEEKY